MGKFGYLAAAAVLACLSAAPSSAQDKVGEASENPPQSNVPAQAPIIVTGDTDEPAGAVLGSRIALEQRVKYSGIATNTGTRGLVPGSGMDQGATVRTITRSKCASDDPLIGQQAACIMIEADAASGKGDIGKAQDLLAYLTLTENFTPYERLAGAKRQYQIAEEQENDASRETALEQMIATGGMPLAEEVRARKALIAMAVNSGRRNLAITRMTELDDIEPLDSQRLANLAVFSRKEGTGDAAAIMQRAIAAREAEGRTVPKGWRDFAASPVSQ